MLHHRDWPAARALLRQAFPGLDDATIRHLLCTGRDHMTGLHHYGRLAGFVRLHLPADRPSTAWVDYLAVAPEAQGTTAAGSLMMWAHEHARAHARRRVELRVDDDNARAIAFYRRLGYRPLVRPSASRGQTWVFDLVGDVPPPPGAGPAPRPPAPLRAGIKASLRRLRHLAGVAAYELAVVLHDRLPFWSSL